MSLCRWTALCLFAVLLVPSALWAQGQNQNQNNNGPPIAGVEIDATGVLTHKVHLDPGGRLMRERLAAARKNLDQQLVRSVQRRYVSLNRLEAAIEQHLAAGTPIPNEMLRLAGLTAISNVFYFPDTREIVIAGPAEGYVEDLSGRAIGVDSGHSILELQDLVVALRAFSPSGNRTNLISVSIDATQEGLAAMSKYYAEVSAKKPSKAEIPKIAKGMKKSLGLQNVTIRGISPRTHFAQVLVEADYRMKLIGIGLEKPAAKIVSYVDRADPRQIARNAMERWFFVPNYECICQSEDGTAMELVSEGVKLIGENERVGADGARVNSGEVNPASQEFVREFTEKYPQLAARSPVYGQLKNLIDMTVAAAYMQQQDFYGQSGWKAELFGDEQRFPVETYETPRQVESAVNVVWKGNLLTTPIGGGVQIQAREALLPSRIQTNNERTIAAKSAVQIETNRTQWWWD